MEKHGFIDIDRENNVEATKNSDRRNNLLKCIFQVYTLFHSVPCDRPTEEMKLIEAGLLSRDVYRNQGRKSMFKHGGDNIGEKYTSRLRDVLRGAPF